MSRKSLIFAIGLLLVSCSGGKDPTPSPTPSEPSVSPVVTPSKEEPTPTAGTVTPTPSEQTPTLEPTPSVPTTPFISVSPTPTESPTPSVVSPTPSETPTQLPTPTPSPVQLDEVILNLNEDEDGLVWACENATSYLVTVNNDLNEQVENTYAFANEDGDYVITIVAKADGYLDSEPITFAYKVQSTSIGDLVYENKTLSASEYVGAYLEVKKDDGEYVKADNDSYSVTSSGFYSVRAAKGFDIENNVYYPEPSDAKMIIASAEAENNYVIEDGSAEDNPTLAEDYTITKFDSGWVGTTASISIDETNKGYSDGNCVRMNYWHHGLYFMYEKAVNLDSSYNALSFITKSTEGSNYVLSFQIKHELIIGGIDLNGVYVKYSVSSAPTNWTKYTVNFDSDEWKVNYGDKDYAFSDVATLLNTAGVKIQSLKDMLPYFDYFQFRVRAAYDNNGSNARSYFDEVMLLAENEQSSIEKIKADITLAQVYAVKSEHTEGNAQFNGLDCTLNLTVDGNPLTLQATAEITEEKTLHLVCDDEQNGFDAIFDSDNGGNSFYLVSVTGPASEAMEGMIAESITVLEDVEQYEETGVGYDQFHAIEERSGMRGAYYADYYTGTEADSSPVGGSKWKLMGSTDYSKLEKTIAHSGSQSMDLKNSSNAMRFMTYGLSDGTSTSFSGKYFSLWIKGGDKGDMNIRISVYSLKKVEPSNQLNNDTRAYDEITVPMNSDWTEYRIPLDTSKFYYGFALVNQNQYNGTQRIYVDDIYAYNDISPWGK